MEVKINKEIRDYSESIFFGLTLRQFICSILACVVAVISYLSLKPVLGTETTSWLCIVLAFPFALMGFVKYNGMTAEKFLINYIRSEFLIPKKLMFKADNIYHAFFKEIISKKEMEELNNENDKNIVQAR